ncbi:MAG: chemotaxis protein CheW, partial [Lutispora sp.]
MAIIQALLVNVGNEKYAIPLNSIKEITSIKTNSIRNVQGQEVIVYRNGVLPIVRLTNVLDIKDYKEDEEELTIVIVKKGEKNSGFIVDSLIGQQEIVIKSLGKYLASIKNIA